MTDRPQKIRIGLEHVPESERAEAEHAIDVFRDQLLVAMVKQRGGTLEIPITEIDDTSLDILWLDVDESRGVFTLKIQRKS